jgi:hypothetical protein
MCRDTYLPVLFYTLIVTLGRKGFTDLLFLTFYKSICWTGTLQQVDQRSLLYSSADSMYPFIDIQPWLSFYCRLHTLLFTSSRTLQR